MGTTSTEEINFRAMTAADIPWVQELDLVSFADPWSQAQWQEEMASDLGHYLVLQHQGQALGYAGLWLVAGEGQVTRVALQPKYRGRGWGKALTRALADRARELGATFMSLEVRSGNIAAQRAYTAVGFKSLGIRPHYYQDNQEDAIIMALEL